MQEWWWRGQITPSLHPAIISEVITLSEMRALPLPACLPPHPSAAALMFLLTQSLEPRHLLLLPSQYQFCPWPRRPLPYNKFFINLISVHRSSAFTPLLQHLPFVITSYICYYFLQKHPTPSTIYLLIIDASVFKVLLLWMESVHVQFVNKMYYRIFYGLSYCPLTLHSPWVSCSAQSLFFNS